MTDPVLGAETGPPPKSLRGIVSRLAGLNVLVAAFGFITGPVLAHALDADGRGILAGIMAPLALAPLVVVFGQTTFATKVIAQGAPVGKVATTVGSVAAAIGLLFIPLGLLGASALAGENETVERFLRIGVLLMPIGLAGGVVGNIAMGLERWDLITVQRLIPPVGAFVAYVTLFALGELTVEWAAAISIVLGFLSILPPLRTLKGAGRWVFDRALARQGLIFGSQVWFITLAEVLNRRLDQMIMLRLTTASELGLYAVAVTISGLPGMFSSAVAQAVFPRVAGGRTDLLARSVRVSLVSVAIPGVGLAVLTPLIVPLVFGRSFEGAVPMVWILLVAMIAGTGPGVLGSSLAGILRRPGIAGVGEVGAVAVTVGGLFLLVPLLGGIGAALVSLAAYSVNFAWLLTIARREVGGSYRDYLVPKREDLGQAKELLRRALRR